MCFQNKPSILLMLCLSFLIISSSTAQPPPPPYNPYDSPPPFASASVDTFDFVNAGPFPPYRRGDYGSTFRELERSASDFTMSLCFYNTTPNAYTLALGVDPSYFVWAANPTDPVKEGAKLSLKDDGNLVLVDVDGRLVWQSNTSNMGVMGSCLLPEKCGAFGVCQNSTCVACPSPQGILPWTAGKCVPPKLGACSLRKAAKYYKVQGVEHFSSMYNKGEGPMALALCQSKCSLDCRCVGYFYHLENSRCWIAYDLMTLTKSGNPKHFGFIKTSN